LSENPSPLREDIQSENGVFILALGLLYSDIVYSVKNEDYEKNLRLILRLFVNKEGFKATMGLLFKALRNVQGTENIICNENERVIEFNLIARNNNAVF